MDKTTMSLETGALGGLIAKFGVLKFFTLGAALIGAGLMAVFRPPKSRKEMLLQAIVALGCSFLFGDTVVRWADSALAFIDLTTAGYVDFLQFYVTVHGLVGALSWGFFGGLAYWRDKFATDPSETIKEIKDVGPSK